jgi:hypothetical protein
MSVFFCSIFVLVLIPQVYRRKSFVDDWLPPMPFEI